VARLITKLCGGLLPGHKNNNELAPQTVTDACETYIGDIAQNGKVRVPVLETLRFYCRTISEYDAAGKHDYEEALHKMKVLHSLGFDPNVRGGRGYTLAMLLAIKGSEPLMNDLLNAFKGRVNVFIKDENQLTAMDHAKQSGHNLTAARLVNYARDSARTASRSGGFAHIPSRTLSSKRESRRLTV